MLALLRRTAGYFRAIYRLVVPMLAAGRGGPVDSVNPVGRWVARVVVVSLILFLLWLLNQWGTLGLKEWIPYGRLGEFWLPLFALCLYVMAWLAWWLYRVLSLEIEPLSSEFPEIDRAWEQAVAALAKADLPLDSTPLFLVLGWNSGSEEALFQAAGLKPTVRGVPKDRDEPLHVTANREGIWVTCPGASELALHRRDAPGGGEAEPVLSSLLDQVDESKTYGSGDASTLRIEDIFGAGGLMKEIEKLRQGASHSAVDVERSRAKLRHLCRLIVRDRQGFCPVNGVLVLLPITVADTRANPQVAASCRNDLTTAFETFRQRCPLLYLVCDLERIDGFAELVERLPPNQLRKRIGQRFPSAPGLSPPEVGEMVQEGIDWVGSNLFPSMVYSMLRVETPGGEDLADALQANTRLFRFLRGVRVQHERLAQFIRDCVPELPGDPPTLAGCYFAGTGSDPAHQAFVPGVLGRLVDDQDQVSWTTDYLEANEAQHRLARHFKTILTVFLALGSVLAVGLVLLLLFPPNKDAGNGEFDPAAAESAP